MKVTASENCDAEDSITTLPEVFMLAAVDPAGNLSPRMIMFPDAEVDPVAPMLVVTPVPQPPSSPRAPLSMVMFPDGEITSTAAK